MEEGRFLQTCSSGRRGRGPATAASVEYLQEVARTRLCLDRASDLLLELQEGSGRSFHLAEVGCRFWRTDSPEGPAGHCHVPCSWVCFTELPEAGRQSPADSFLLAPSELAEEQQCFLRHVEQFCTRAGNDWHRVYLVRRLARLRGMEFVQSLSRQGHRCQWVFPKGVTAQQVRAGPWQSGQAAGTTPHPALPPSPHNRGALASICLALGLCVSLGLGHVPKGADGVCTHRMRFWCLVHLQLI